MENEESKGEEGGRKKKAEKLRAKEGNVTMRKSGEKGMEIG